MDDPDINPVLQQKLKNERLSRNEQNPYSVATIHYISFWDQLIIKDEVLYNCCTTTLGSTTEQLILPKVMTHSILNMCHCSLLSGYLGIKKTRFRVTRNFYWFELREDIQIFVISCETCPINKPLTHKPKAPLGSMFFAAPWDCVAFTYYKTKE